MSKKFASIFFKKMTIDILLIAASIIGANAFASDSAAARRVPTEFQAASLAKQMVNEEKSATLMVRTSSEHMWNGKRELVGFDDFPFGQVELISYDCSSDKGDILVFSTSLQLTVQSWTTYMNNVTFAIHQGARYGTDPMLKHRATLMGSMELLGNKATMSAVQWDLISNCFFAKNPDARGWRTTHEFMFSIGSRPPWYTTSVAMEIIIT